MAKNIKLKLAEIDLARESMKDIPDPSCLQKMIMTVNVNRIKIRRYSKVDSKRQKASF